MMAAPVTPDEFTHFKLILEKDGKEVCKFSSFWSDQDAMTKAILIGLIKQPGILSVPAKPQHIDATTE